METKFLNFKKLEVTGRTKAEAFEKAPFEISGDATQAYKKWLAKQTNGVTEKDKTAFCIDYLAKKSKNIANVGFAITIESAVADTKARPYKITDVKNEKGKRKYRTKYVWVDDETGKTVVSVDTTKADAKNAIKVEYTEKGYRGNATLHMVKEVVEGEPIAAHATYSPSTNSKVGTYVVFGIVKD